MLIITDFFPKKLFYNTDIWNNVNTDMIAILIWSFKLYLFIIVISNFLTYK